MSPPIMEVKNIVKILCGGFPCTKFSVAQKNNREKLNFPINMFMDWKQQQGKEWFKHIDDFEGKLSLQQNSKFKFGEGMQLFFNCVVAKEKMNPDYFIFENVSSMDKGIKEFIQAILQCDVTETNANKVSAQNRKRVIFHNLGIIPEAEDKGILLKDILESGIIDKEKAYCLNVDNIKPVPMQVSRKHGIKDGKDKSLSLCSSDWRGLNRNQMQNAVVQPVCVAQRGRYLRDDGGVMQHFEPREDGKTNTLTTVSKDNLVAEPVCLRYIRTEEGKQLRKEYEAHSLKHGFNEHRMLSPRPDGKSNTISTVVKDNIIAEPVRIGTIDSDSQAHRVYSPFGKSVTLVSNGGGQGAKTGLYATPININHCKCLSEKEMEYMLRETSGDRNHFDFGYHQDTTKDKAQCLLANLHKGVPYNVCCQMVGEDYCINLDDYKNVTHHDNGNIEVDGKLIYWVQHGKIPYKDKLYDINLSDGYYIIRKLTPLECERLQCLPDGYTDKGVSDSQRYKMIGNGWCKDDIKRFFDVALRGTDKNEQVECQSFYDGIATARLIIDDLGFQNVNYIAYEVDKYAMKVATANYPDIVEAGDAFVVREDDWLKS